MKTDVSRGKVRDMRWLLPIALVLLASLLCYWLLGCGALAPVRRATPGGIVLVYDDPHDGDYRLPAAKVREIDERWAALLECIPQEARCQTEPPEVQIIGPCDSFVDPYGYRVRGETFGSSRVVVPGSLGALAHEFAHLVACDSRHSRDSWPRKCGDLVDSEFRKKYPPVKCKGDK